MHLRSVKQALSRAWAPIDWLVEQVQNGIDTVVQQRVAGEIPPPVP